MPEGNLKLIFGSAIRSQRAELGISQEELADRSGLHRTYISDVERGARNPSLESINKLARALELSVATLFERTVEQETSRSLMEILLVEDSTEDAEMSCRAFRQARIANSVHVIRDGVEALEFLFATGAYKWRRNEPLPGLILLDLNLPTITGLEVLRCIKADRRTQKIPIVVLTASGRNSDIAECKQLGARGYIVKPVEFQKFTEVTPHIEMEWALVKPAPRTKSGASG